MTSGCILNSTNNSRTHIIDTNMKFNENNNTLLFNFFSSNKLVKR
jgi:hypothetical protein